MTLRCTKAGALHAGLAGVVGQPRLEGEDSRSGAARTAAATILHRTRAWRFDLRSERFLDKEPDPREVPKEVVGEVRSNLTVLRQEWDHMFPENPIFSKASHDD